MYRIMGSKTFLQANLARQHRTYTTAYYKGEADTGGSVLARLETSGPSLREFLWYSSIVRGGNSNQRRLLL